MSETRRSDIYRYGDYRVDIKLPSKAWFARIRCWSGKRWPRVEKTWYARTRRWLPWFSLERQAVRAVEYANRRNDVLLARERVVQHVQTALRLLS